MARDIARRATASLSYPPASPEVASLLRQATGFLEAGQPGEAIAPLREAALLDPWNVNIHHDLGLACLETGLLPDAIAALRTATEKNSQYTDAFFRLGIAFEKQGALKEAVAAYDRATDLQPSHTEAWFRAGAVVYLMGHREEAIDCFRRAAATGGNSSLGRLGKARALLTEDRFADAEKVLRHTVALDPNNAMAFDLLGNLLTEYGRFEEARVCLERAIALAPLLSGSYYELVRCRKVTREDGLMEKMEAALSTPGLDRALQQRVHLALGKAADDLGDYGLAMQHFDKADALRRASVVFDSDVFDRAVDTIISEFSQELLTRAAELGNADAKPILIVGMPRSGTTLVEQIISSHSQASGADELHFWNQRQGGWLRLDRPKDEALFVAKAARDYLALLRSIAPKAARVTDKMPFNFLWAGLIHLALPRATIIHCRRAPIDTAISIHQTHFHPSLGFPTGGEELVRYFKSYQRLMEHWRNVLPPDRLFEVDYEELTREPEPIIRSMVKACGLPWEDACLRPQDNPRAVRTPSKWQARQPIYRDSVARWRRYEPYLGSLRSLVKDSAVELPAHAN